MESLRQIRSQKLVEGLEIDLGVFAELDSVETGGLARLVHHRRDLLLLEVLATFGKVNSEGLGVECLLLWLFFRCVLFFIYHRLRTWAFASPIHRIRRLAF